MTGPASTDQNLVTLEVTSPAVSKRRLRGQAVSDTEEVSEPKQRRRNHYGDPSNETTARYESRGPTDAEVINAVAVWPPSCRVAK